MKPWDGKGEGKGERLGWEGRREGGETGMGRGGEMGARQLGSANYMNYTTENKFRQDLEDKSK